MTEWTRLLNLSIELSGVILCAMGMLLVILSPNIQKQTARYFLALYSGLFLYAVSSVSGLLMRGMTGANFRAALSITNYIEFLMPVVLLYVVTRYLLSILAPENELRGVRILFLALLLIAIVLLTVSQFIGLYYRIDENNLYHRQAGYPLSFAVPALMILADLCLLVRYRDRLSKRERIAFWIYTVVPVLGMIPQSIYYGPSFTIFATIVAGLAMYVFIVIDQTEHYYRKREEIARQQASIQVLQMRPHFIYNTMMSIYYLCQQDPEKAQQVTLDFTSYLRNNFTAIVKEGTIPFTEELEHTRAYLAVEQVRFEDKLFVEMDTPHTRFRIPPLTLPPIVEHAVKHGVSPDLDPLRLSVLTRETKAGSEIIVEDTGPGFAPADDDEPHIALANIRERLEMMCGGTLEITPREAGGTRVTIRIPLKENRK